MRYPAIPPAPLETVANSVIAIIPKSASAGCRLRVGGAQRHRLYSRGPRFLLDRFQLIPQLLDQALLLRDYLLMIFASFSVTPACCCSSVARAFSACELVPEVGNSLLVSCVERAFHRGA